MRKIQPTVEGAFLAALTVIFYLSSIYIPVLGIILSFLCPLPVMFLVIRWNWKVGFLTSLVASFVVFAFAGVTQALTCLLGFTLLGIVMGVTIKKGWSSFEVIAWNTVVSLLSKLALVGVALLLLGKNPLTENIALMEEALHSVSRMFRSVGEMNIQSIIDFMKMALPAVLIIASLFDTTLNFLLGRLVGQRIGVRFPEIAAFGQWQMPRSVFWAFVLSWLFLFIGSNTFLGKIGVNLQIVTQMLFLVHGLSLVYYFLSRYIRSRVLKIVILFFLLFQPVFSTLLSWLGVFDVWFDFRKLRSDGISKGE
ncbi:MAG: YybS family protein [Candidatus Atribacteria bacterium]|nr:YybS family protein [Candidatus Atribacteria bacterium]